MRSLPAAPAAPTGGADAGTSRPPRAGPVTSAAESTEPGPSPAAASSACRAWMPDVVRSGTSLRNQMSTKPTKITHAATRNTRSIDCEKPCRNGSASRGSIRCSTEESWTTWIAPVAGLTAGALTGFDATAGSASAAWNDGVAAAARKAPPM